MKDSQSNSLRNQNCCLSDIIKPDTLKNIALAPAELPCIRTKLSFFLFSTLTPLVSSCPVRDLAFYRGCNPLVAEQVFKYLLNL